MCLSVQFGVMKTRELREMLQDEDKINHIVKCSEKVSTMWLRGVETNVGFHPDNRLLVFSLCL